MVDAYYPPPNAATTAPAAAYPPPNVQPVVNEPSIHARVQSPIYSALINVGATPHEATTLTAISGAESNFGKSPVSPPNKNGSRDYGYFQINEAAHPEMGGAAVAKMPLTDQAERALKIARSREGYGAWVTYKSGAYKGYLGSNAAGAPSPTGAPPPTSPAKPATTGNMLASLFQPTGQDSKGLSPVEQAGQALGGAKGQQSQAPQGPDPAQQLQLQQIAAQTGNARTQQLDARAQQIAAQVQARGMQPLSWGNAPPGTMMGAGAGQQGARADAQAPFAGMLQQQQLMSALGDLVPGTTLNSIGDS